MAIVAVLVMIWLMRRPPDNIIPAKFTGIWLDEGAECKDTDAQARITASTIDYDHLSFKADGLMETGKDSISLTGKSFPSGYAVRETVRIRMLDHRTKIEIVAPDLRLLGPFVRCPASNG